MRGLKDKKMITVMALAVAMGVMLPATAESLFRAGISQNVSPITPRSWFQSIRATNIGDMVVIEIDEKNEMENTVSLSSNKKSDFEDNFTPILENILPGKGVVPDLDGWGAVVKINNSTTLKRSNTLKQMVTTQVVQVLPNGNLVVQGKKSVINSGERQDLVVSGIVNPRLINGDGRVKSSTVANLQIAIVGKGTVSRSQSDGLLNKFLRIFF